VYAAEIGAHLGRSDDKYISNDPDYCKGPKKRRLLTQRRYQEKRRDGFRIRRKCSRNTDVNSKIF
jgi:hypothetical protein